jgi:hypothetical protein
MKASRILGLITVLLVLFSCQDDWKFSADTRYTLDFSVDTVRLDTVFTGIASASAGFMVYNPNDAGLRFDAVMGGGAGSPFRMNLDGEGGAVITGLEIPAGDSLFCFVAVNIPASDETGLLNAFDSIRFVLESGLVQHVRLSAYGQNAVVLKGMKIESDTRLDATLPYLVYDSLYVAEGATLTVAPGAKLYFHSKSVLDVAGRVMAEGSADSVIIMRGDRLDAMNTAPPVAYDLLAAQWGGIRIRGCSYGNVFSHCDIHSGEFGIIADSASSVQTKFSLYSSVVHNMSGSCIEATGCKIDVANSQITNAGTGCVDIAGGRSEFTFCTIAGFSLWSIGSQAVRISDSRDGNSVPFAGASFRNCIITGRHESEFIADFADSVSQTAPYSVENSLLMVKDTADVRFRNVVFEKMDQEAFASSNFVDHTVRGYGSVFALDSLSRARGIADTLSRLWPVDLAGVHRPPVGADAGCYQFVPATAGK